MMTGQYSSLRILVPLLLALGVAGMIYASRRTGPARTELVDTRLNPEAVSRERAPDAVAVSLRGARHALQSIEQAAGESDWVEIKNQLGAFRQATHVLPSPELRHPDVSMVLLDFFSLYRVQLERAIEREDLEKVLFTSNQLEGIVEDLMGQLIPGRPAELGRLRFLSRDINYWAGAGDQQMLQVRAAGLEKLWSDLRPLIVDHHGRAAADNFDLVLTRIESAEGPEEFQLIAPQLQDAVRQVEAVLAKK